MYCDVQLMYRVMVVTRLGVNQAVGRERELLKSQCKDKSLFLDQRQWGRGAHFLKVNNKLNNQSPNIRLGFILLSQGHIISLHQ